MVIRASRRDHETDDEGRTNKASKKDSHHDGVTKLLTRQAFVDGWMRKLSRNLSARNSLTSAPALGSCRPRAVSTFTPTKNPGPDGRTSHVRRSGRHDPPLYQPPLR